MRLFLIGFITLLILPQWGCSSRSKAVEEQVADSEAAAKEESAEAQPEQELWQWDYKGEKGPENWAGLNPQYEMCTSGMEQSPINLVWQRPQKKSPLVVKYKEGDAVIANTGYTFRIEFTPQSEVIFNGQAYMLEKAEFRTPSEHNLSGNSLPMEIQFYHRSPNGLKQAVLSLFVIIGKGSAWFDELWAKAIDVPVYKTSEKFSFNPDLLIPPRQTFYHYQGSLTHPPCLQGVDWFVFNTPLQLSKDQIASFRAMYDHNNRPIQKSLKRKVTNY